MIIKYFKIIINMIFSNIKLFILKLFHIYSFEFKCLNNISIHSTISITNKGKIKLGKGIKINSGTVISSLNGGYLEIGDNSFANNNCQIVAHESIKIGKDVMIGPNVVIVDHDHMFDNSGIKKRNFKTRKIIIGNNVWIGANSVILKGVKIGNNSIVGAGSVVNENIPDNSIFIQKREKTIIKIK